MTETTAQKPRANKQPANAPSAPRSPLTRRQATELAATAPKPDEGVGSGAYIRALIMTPGDTDAAECRFSSREIVGLVRLHFKGSVATAHDVSWNRGWLRKHGTDPLPLRRG